jgi:hypothetical protein
MRGQDTKQKRNLVSGTGYGTKAQFSILSLKCCSEKGLGGERQKQTTEYTEHTETDFFRVFRGGKISAFIHYSEWFVNHERLWRFPSSFVFVACFLEGFGVSPF